MTVSVEDLQAQIAQLTTNITASAGQDVNPYFAARASFGNAQMIPYAPGKGPVETGKQGFITNDLGQMLWANGVFVDPNDPNSLMFPPPSSGIDPSAVPGSPQWLTSIQDSWTDAKANGWREKLFNQGYEVGKSGGMGWDLLEALREYHQRRYLNAGKVIPVSPRGAVTREDVEALYDPVALKEEVKSWGQVPFEEDLDPNTAEYFANRSIELAVRLAKQNPEWSPEQVMAGAEVRAQKEFIKSPGVKGALKDLEEDEMDETLRDSIVSISQIRSV